MSMTETAAREVGAIVGVDKSVSCVSCSKVESVYTMVIQDSGSFEHWDSPEDARILQLHNGIPPKGVYCTECYLNDYKPKKKEEVKVECVICNTQTSNELDYDYDDDTGFHCCQKTDCLRQFYRG